MKSEKTGFKIAQHNQLGLELQTMYDRLNAISKSLTMHYRVSGADAKAHGYTNKMIENLNHLRSELERLACIDLGKNHIPDVKTIYYRAGREDHVSNPQPIRPFPEE